MGEKSISKGISLDQKHEVVQKDNEHHSEEVKESNKQGVHDEKKAPKRKFGLLENDDPASLAFHNDEEFKNGSTTVKLSAFAESHVSSGKTIYEDLEKVIEESDVILEVLDAQDPSDTRCLDLEEKIHQTYPEKRIVLLLNKIDIIPQEARLKWLDYLRRGKLPVVDFRCSREQKRPELKGKHVTIPSCTIQTHCVGAKTLMELLKNIAPNYPSGITVGIVGHPNVGKSSLVYTFKSPHLPILGSAQRLERSMQEILLDVNVKLFDRPGIVMPKSGDSNPVIALRNCKRIEELDDPVQYAKEILKVCPDECLISVYNLPSFSNVDDFLRKVASVNNMLKKNGDVDFEAAARKVLLDWNRGVIPHYVLPPTIDMEEVETTILFSFSKPAECVHETFGPPDSNAFLYNKESSFIGNLASVEVFCHVVPTSSPLNFDEQMLAEDSVNPEEIKQVDEAMACDEIAALEKPSSSNGRNERLYSAEGILGPRKNPAENQHRKAKDQALVNEMGAYCYVDCQMKDDSHDKASDGYNDEVSDEIVPMIEEEMDA